MEIDYDVIVAGGGMTGLITATTIAKFTNQNMKILVLDRNEEITPARKNISGWTCGDAVSKRSIDFYEKEVGISYKGRTYEEVKKICWKDGFRAIYAIVKYNLFR